jgi:neutral ceramidase
MVGFIRQRERGQGFGLPLEASAVVLDDGACRIVLCGVDAGIMKAATAARLQERIADAVGAHPDGVLLNLSHTHLAPIACPDTFNLVGELDDDQRAASLGYVRWLSDRLVTVCRLAADRLETAEIAWAVGEVDEAVNRRERLPGGGTALGWNPDGMVDPQVTAFQARRPDGTAIATFATFGCHPVTTGYDMSIYSADFPGALRATVRRNDGGECIFFQGAGGNVLPRVAFTDGEAEARRMGRRIGLEVVRALADRATGPRRVVAQPEASLVPIVAYRIEAESSSRARLGAAARELSFPLEPMPRVDEVRAFRALAEERVRAAREAGDPGALKVALVPARWAAWVEALQHAGGAPEPPRARTHAVRIGDGVIVSAPGEVFAELGLAVKERAPGRPTVYVGYTNGLVGYFSAASEYAHGGYEPAGSHYGFMVAAPFAAACDGLLVEAGVRLAERLFPDAPPWPDERGWLASGAVPDLPPTRLEHPGVPARPGVPTWLRADGSRPDQNGVDAR